MRDGSERNKESERGRKINNQRQMRQDARDTESEREEEKNT